MTFQTETWSIAAIATSGVILRPWRLPEYLWALGGAVLLVLLDRLPWQTALAGAARGTDVYLFLSGMMLLSEIARLEGLFDWLAAHAARAARGSAARLFTLIYIVGIGVTAFLSNDATAVVLTPAVAAAASAARAEKLPYLFICAFVANAASFLLPISNPANLVIFAGHMPPLAPWLARFALPSLAAITVTYLALRLTFGRRLDAPIAREVAIPQLPAAGILAALGIAATALVLLACSLADRDLGLPTCLCGIFATLLVLSCSRAGPAEILGGIAWGVLPLVAGLFILVTAVDATGATAALAQAYAGLARQHPALAPWMAGIVPAVSSNLTNNLPAGLLVASALHASPVPHPVTDAALIGIDLGPNLSVTGSLATLLWLGVLRREGLHVGALAFLRVGLVAMPLALALALAALRI